MDLNKKLTKQQLYEEIANTIKLDDMYYHRKSKMVWRFYKKREYLFDGRNRRDFYDRIKKEVFLFYKKEFPAGLNINEMAKIYNLIIKSLPEIHFSIKHD